MELQKRILRRDNSLYWARKTHEIVKYSPDGYDGRGVYLKDEWSDMSDIGQTFGGKVFDMAEYLLVESRYVECAMKIALHSNCKFLTVGYIENHSCVTYDGRKIHYRSRIPVEDVGFVLRGMLRNEFYCVLVNLSKKVQIDVGYDYYMHVMTPLDNAELQEIVSSCHLYLNPRARHCTDH